MGWWPKAKTNGHSVPVAEAPVPVAPSTLPSVVPPVVSMLPVSDPHSGATRKLSRAQQFRVCELLGQHYTTYEVAEAVQQEFGITVTQQAIACYLTAPKWQAVIHACRTTFLTEAMTAIPIAKKPVRLRRYETIYQQAMRKQQLDQARLALLAAQQEMEGMGETNIYIHQNILHMDTAALEARRKELTERLQALEVTHAVEQA